jgi:hypothetical protein
MEEDYKVDRDIRDDTYDVDTFDDIQEGRGVHEIVESFSLQICPGARNPIIIHMVAHNPTSALHGLQLLGVWQGAYQV